MPVLENPYNNYTGYGSEYDEFFLKPRKWIRQIKAKKAAKKKKKEIMQQMGSGKPAPVIAPKSAVTSKPLAKTKPKVVQMAAEQLPTKPKVTTKKGAGMTIVGNPTTDVKIDKLVESKEGHLKAGLVFGIIVTGTVGLIMTYSYIRARTPQAQIAIA